MVELIDSVLLEGGIEYVAGEEVCFHQEPVDLKRFADVERFCFAYALGNPKMTVDHTVLGRADAREFVVISIGGLSSNFVLYRDELCPERLLTLEAALKECRLWESYADTIGGKAKVLHLHSGYIIRDD